MLRRARKSCQDDSFESLCGSGRHRPSHHLLPIPRWVPRCLDAEMRPLLFLCIIREARSVGRAQTSGARQEGPNKAKLSLELARVSKVKPRKGKVKLR